jgi:hypothetical protein
VVIWAKAAEGSVPLECLDLKLAVDRPQSGQVRQTQRAPGAGGLEGRRIETVGIGVAGHPRKGQTGPVLDEHAAAVQIGQVRQRVGAPRDEEAAIGSRQRGDLVQGDCPRAVQRQRHTGERRQVGIENRGLSGVDEDGVVAVPREAR